MPQSLSRNVHIHFAIRQAYLRYFLIKRLTSKLIQNWKSSGVLDYKTFVEEDWILFVLYMKMRRSLELFIISDTRLVFFMVYIIYIYGALLMHCLML